MSEKRYLTVNDVADRLQMSARTIYTQVAPKAKKKFPIKPKRFGKLLRWDVRDVDAYLESL